MLRKILTQKPAKLTLKPHQWSTIANHYRLYLADKDRMVSCFMPSYNAAVHRSD
jgi:hypothetical protein